jgi:hypothetical protein
MTHDDWMFLFTHYWWVLIVLIAVLGAMFNSSMIYAHRRDKLALLKTYVDQGKDIPPELSKALGYGNGHPWADMDWSRYNIYSPYRQLRRFVISAAFAAGFGIAYINNPSSETFEIVAVIFGVLAVGNLFIMLTMRSPDAK